MTAREHEKYKHYIAVKSVRKSRTPRRMHPTNPADAVVLNCSCRFVICRFSKQKSQINHLALKNP